MKPSKSNKVLDSIELVEASSMTELRKRFTAWFSRRTGKTPNTPFMLKLGYLPKGTKSSKMDKGVEVDVVSKPFHIAETTKDGKPFNVVTLNERLGLNSLREPLASPEAIKRLSGPIVFALCDLSIPRELNKRGVPITTLEYKRAHETCGFTKWNHPNGLATALIDHISTEVTLPVDAFELPEPAKRDTGRKVYKAEIRDESSKVIATVVCPKSLYDAYRDKVSTLTMTLIAVDAAESAKANELAKQAERANDAKADEAAKVAMLSKLDEDIKAVIEGETSESDEPVEVTK
jgi:hypothetical protein